MGPEPRHAGGLSCGHVHADDADDDRDPVTENATDLRRAREHAASVVEELNDDIQAWLEDNYPDLTNLPDDASKRQRVNQKITRLAQARLAEELVTWLADRRSTTMSRAARAAVDRLQRRLGEEATDALRLGPTITPRDRELNRIMSEVDVGLLEDLSDDAADRITRHLRTGVSRGESVQELGERVDLILTEKTADLSADERRRRQKTGVEGQTIKSKGELIAHDSVQQGYTLAATRRYLRNGVRYARYQATLDTRTTDLCRRLDGELIDLTNSVWLVPPNHPWCRSSIQPVLASEVEGEEPLTREDIAADWIGTVERTNSYRPAVMDPEAEYNPTPLSGAV